MGKSDFSKRLKKVLIDADMSQLELANQIPARYVTVSAWCNGKYLPQLFIFKRICEVLDVSADYLLGLENKNG